MKQFKKLIACVMAATLVLGSTTVFFGAETEKVTSEEGSFGGNGNFEGSVDTEIFDVVVPVESVTSGSAFDFILDPEGLISTTSGAAYGGVTFVTNGSMYFKVSDTQYDVKSQTLTAQNLSSVEVNISLDATVTVPTTNAALGLAEDANWGTDTALEIYLEVVEVSGDGTTVVTSAAIATEESDNVYTGRLESTLASYDAYEVVYNATEGAYEYVISDEPAEGVTADTYAFYLTGECNTNADWSQYEEGADPTISVVWKVEMVGADSDDEDAVTAFNNGTYNVDYSKANGLTIPYTLAKGTTIKSVKIGSSTTTVAESNYVTIESAQIKLTGAWSSASTGQKRYLVITLSDDTTITFNLTIKA